MSEELRAIITEVAAAAGEGADALRRAGIGVELEGYRIEVHVDPDDHAPAAVVTMVFGAAPADREPRTVDR